jgi:phenylacetate-CoA ligase
MILQRAFAKRVYWPLVQKIKGENASNVLIWLSKSQWLSRDELFDRQWKLVRKTVNNAARNVPHYQGILKDIAWDFKNKRFSYKDFLKIPLLEKETLRDRMSEILNPFYSGRITKGSTSGSTGTSLSLFYSSEHESYSEACRWRAKKWWKIEPGSPHVSIWGRPYSGHRDRITQCMKSYLMNNRLFSAFDLNEAALESIWKKIYRFKPAIIYGYPSGIYPLSVYIKENKKPADRLNLKVIMTTAESITSHQRKFIEEVFKCKTANEYGCSETGGFVYECPEGNWHISTELTFIEFLDSKGKPLPPESKGEIVVTHLRNHYMPLIRYRLGDFGASLADECSCGRQLPLMIISMGKESDIFNLSNGKEYSSEIFDYINLAIIKSYPESIKQFRAIQDDYDSFEIQIKPGKNGSKRAEALFERLLKDQLGPRIRIRFTAVNEIKREASGKLRYFISKVKSA